jgi:hypothetical protein
VDSVARKFVLALMGKRGLVLAVSVVAAIAMAKVGHHADSLGMFDGG